MHRRAWIPGCAAAPVCRCKVDLNLANLTVGDLHIEEMLDVNMANWVEELTWSV